MNVESTVNWLILESVNFRNRVLVDQFIVIVV
jgi:hypothetical protein